MLSITLVLLELALRLIGFQPFAFEKQRIASEPKLFAQKDENVGYQLVPGEFTFVVGDAQTFIANHLPDGTRNVGGLASASKEKVHFYGCSLTYGFGLDDEATFPYLIQSKLPEYSVKNYGVNGYGLAQMYLRLKAQVAQGNKPRIAVFGYASFQDERTALLRNWKKSLARFNHHHQEFRTLNLPYVRRSFGELEWLSDDMTYEPNWLVQNSSAAHLFEQWGNVIQNWFVDSHLVSQTLMQELKRYCENEQITLVIAGLEDDLYTKSMLDFCRDEQIATIDVMVDLKNPANSFLPLDPHPNAQSHQFYADGIEPALRHYLMKQAE